MSSTTTVTAVPPRSLSYDEAKSYININPSPPPFPRENEPMDPTLVDWFWANTVIQEGDDKFKTMIPLLAALAFVLLGTAALRWRVKGWRSRAQDLSILALCLGVCSSRRIHMMVCAATVSAGYAVWILMPAAYTAQWLPSHDQFIRSLKLEPQSDDEPEHCMVCWEDKPLARLSCTHKACKECLRLIGQTDQTDCPLCRRPLFKTDEQIELKLLQKLRMTTNAVTLVLHGVLVAYRARRGERDIKWRTFGLLLPITLMSLVVLVRIRWQRKEWWRGDGKMPLRLYTLISVATAAAKWLEAYRTFD
ncbi:hypothetical protein Tdes44962_MAKER05570 [Teratosphaeria destructans]|uniref:RING-type domain-containing protein n=1 Tax=Teratosphaeria destructans TaxID=418781 RepID=A0A9W7SJL8_9PEZI|nr:hypothetical protein Tdes44962_MAKER05570 [Teratosphaeria destructans]